MEALAVSIKGHKRKETTLLVNMSHIKLKVALLGATGSTGIQALQQLLARGHTVRALVRTPEKVGVQHENLTVCKTDIYDNQSLMEGFQGCDAVMSCLGVRGSVEGSFYLDTMQVIVKAMRDSNVKRIVTMTSWGTYRDSRSPYFVEYFFRFVIAKVLDSMRQMELFFERECSDLDYTIVRPPGLQDQPITSKTIETKEDCPCVPQGWCSTKFSMPRADVARFMVECVETKVFQKKAVAIL